MYTSMNLSACSRLVALRQVIQLWPGGWIGWQTDRQTDRRTDRPNFLRLGSPRKTIVFNIVPVGVSGGSCSLRFAMRAIYDDKITSSKLRLGDRRVHVYNAADSVLFSEQKQRSWPRRVRSAFHPRGSISGRRPFPTGRVQDICSPPMPSRSLKK